MIPFNFHHLYYFFVVAKEGSVSRAAKELHIGQPAVSAQLRQFENYLNIKLFEREGRRLVLTEKGRNVLSYAKEIFDLGQEFIKSCGEWPKQGSSILRVGVLNGVPNAYTDALLSFILKGPSGIYVTLQKDSQEKLITGLTNYTLDLVLTDAPVQTPDSAQFQSHRVGRIPVVFCASPKIAKRYKVLPRDLNGAPMIYPTSHHQVYHAVQEYLLKHKVKPKVIAEIQDLENVRRLVLAGFGIAPINVFSIKHAPASEKTVILDRKHLSSIYDSVYLITKKRIRPNPWLEKIISRFSLPA